METRSKAQREATGTDVGEITTGEAVVRLARDPSPPILTPVRFQATPVPIVKIIRMMQNSVRSSLSSHSGLEIFHIYSPLFGTSGSSSEAVIQIVVQQPLYKLTITYWLLPNNMELIDTRRQVDTNKITLL